jgi:hypothetical protein
LTTWGFKPNLPLPDAAKTDVQSLVDNCIAVAEERMMRGREEIMR